MLTTKQRSYLRSLAQNLPDALIIGKDGITANVIAQAAGSIEANELIKIKMLPSLDASVRDTANTLAGHLSCDVVSTIGRKFVLYRRNPQEQRIFLPG